MVHDGVTSHFMACRIPWYKLHFTWNDCGECVTIICALRWGVASVGIISTSVAHPLWEKHFRCKIDTGGPGSSKVVIVKKADMWP